MTGPERRRDPFAVLGLQAGPGLSDDDVRSAWRRIAAATHPDRADGGNPGRYAAAAAAYTELRTRFGRGEALAGLAVGQRPADGMATAGGGRGPARRALTMPVLILARLPGRIARGRPVRLAFRAIGTAAVAWASLAAGAPHGAGPAVVAGALTWLILTGRQDLAP